MSYEISLYKFLENIDKELCGRLPQIRDKAMSLMSYTAGKFPYYTPHDFSHSASVEENLNWLVPDHLKQEMNPYELFFLITAAWLHDWGMIGEEREDPKLIRDEHHIRTESNFERMYDKMSLSEHEARIIGRICKGHRKVDLSKREYDDVVFGQNNKIRQRFLAALLRIADECDIAHNRTPEVIYYTINPTDQSEAEFKKHLSISGIGQLEEKHKIYISAIARDPKGARTLREVAQKIQSELDGVKGILSQHSLVLDLVDLKLETRGFIDKPIGFEINKTKIVDLLIGDHLYGNQDAAIRELVQNSIDTCKLKELIVPEFKCKIVLRMDNNELVIEDNGQGMDYYEAKHFLSNIGTSFYKSELFKERLGDKSYSPISQYGIGILSCFLICNKVSIETLKEGHEACKFSVESVYEEWKYEKGHQKNPGTKITLELNEAGRGIILKDSLQRYFLCPEIPIEYRTMNEGHQTFVPIWTAAVICHRFARNTKAHQDSNPKEILNISMPNYDLIIGTPGYDFNEKLVLFNHGIYVGQFPIVGLSYPYFICVNLKADLVDLHISRENVKINMKWYNFIYSIFNDVFSSLKKHDNSNNKEKIISLFSTMLNDRYVFDVASLDESLVKQPFLKSFLGNAYFPVVVNGKVEFIENIYAISGKNLKFYNCCSRSLSDELSLISTTSPGATVVVNPYSMPYVMNEKEQIYPLLKFILADTSILDTAIDLHQILLENSEVLKINYPELLPDNVQLATFKYNIHPLVVVIKQPIVGKHKHSLGTSYWGNILLWKQLSDKEHIVSVLNSIEEIIDRRFERIKILNEPIFYIDYSDIFVNSIFEKRGCERFNEHLSKKVYRYFKYLSYLPLVVNDLSSTLIFLEVIDTLESEIAESLNISPPATIFERMRPNSKLYLAYFVRFGLKYIEQ